MKEKQFTYITVDDGYAQFFEVFAKDRDQAVEKIKEEFTSGAGDGNDMKYDPETVEALYVIEGCPEVNIDGWVDEYISECEEHQAIASLADTVGEVIETYEDEYAFLKKRMAQLEKRMAKKDPSISKKSR